MDMSRFRSAQDPSGHPSGHYSARSEFWAGCRGITPLVIGAIPFGIIFGTLASSSGLSAAGAIAMSVCVFAGSSQFIALGLLSAGTSLPLIILTTLVVNLRHLLYAVSLVPHVRNLPQIWKLLIGFWLTDEAFAVAIARYNQPDISPYKHWYYLGVALFMYVNWQICTWIGITVGQMIPNAASWGLDFAMSVTFIGMVIPYVINRPMGIAVAVAGLVSLLAHGLPHQLGLIVAALVGISAGMIAESINPLSTGQKP
jgi:4-azaleucine resistance transporter AzlC